MSLKTVGRLTNGNRGALLFFEMSHELKRLKPEQAIVAFKMLLAKTQEAIN